ncbi:UNVERIFIED_CONTAM: hypothetical protein K2H54_004761 [Gekko kuhli]
MGPLVGCLALCHFDDSALVAQQAADGLIHLYRSAACCKEEDHLRGSVRRVWKDEVRGTLRKAPLEDTETIIEIFQNLLSPEELSGVFLTALGAFAETSVQSTCAGVCIAALIRKASFASLGRVTDIVKILHGHLQSITDHRAQHEVKCILRLLGDCHMSELCDALLRYSPDCDSSADLWRTLVSFHYNAVGALNQLLTRLLGDLQEPPASEEEAFALGLAAAQVLAELLRKPPGAFSATLHDRWSVAWIAVVLWVSRLHSHQAFHGATARQPPQSSPPLGVAGQELLTDAETFLDGVSLLMR